MKCIKSLFSFLYRDPEVHLRLIRRGKTSLLEWMRIPNPSKITSLTSLPNYRSHRSLSSLYKQCQLRRQSDPWTSYLVGWEKLNETKQCYFLPTGFSKSLWFFKNRRTHPREVWKRVRKEYDYANISLHVC